MPLDEPSSRPSKEPAASPSGSDRRPTAHDEPAVLVRAGSGVGRLTLNRPAAINALTNAMIGEMQSALDAWRDDPTIRTVVIDGAGERGLCAGGDIRALYHHGRSNPPLAERFWRDEYLLNSTIDRYPKPVVALMDGLVMGGGVGISAHASHRVVSRTSTIGMPEVAIGLAPDVGGCFLLSRAPGELGTHLALTTRRIKADEAIYCGLADHFVPAENRDELFAALAETDATSAIAALRVPVAEPVELVQQRVWIDQCYRSDSVEDIVARLAASDHESARQAADQILQSSPTATKVTLRALRAARDDAVLEDTLERDLRVVLRSIAGHDFLEGIRAQVIDRDRSPRWYPTDLREVSIRDVEAFFAPLGDRELTLPRVQTTGTTR